MAGACFAEEASEATLDSVITTATRTESTLELAPGNASVVTRRDIEHTPRASLKELVSGQEGVVTGQTRGQSDLAPSMLLRGIPNQARTLIMIDGVPVQTSYSGQAQAIGGLTADDLQRVEIVRGPYSSLYGSSAMGGVINFITAMPKTREYRATVGYGDAFEDGRAQKQLIKGYVSAAGEVGERLKLKASFGWLDSQGYHSDYVATANAPVDVNGAQRVTTSTGGTQYIIGNKGRGALDKYDALLRAELQASASDTLNAWYLRSNVHNQYENPESYLRDSTGTTVYAAATASATAPIRENAFATNANDVTSEITSIGWKHRFADSRLDVRYSRMTVDEWYTTAGTTTATTLAGGPGTVTPRWSENGLLDVIWENPVGNSLLLVGGQYKTTDSIADTYSLADWHNEGSVTAKTTSSGGKERVYSLFADWQTQITDRLGATIGGRYENWTGHDGYTADFTQPANTTLNQQYAAQTKRNFSPKISGSYQLFPTTRIKASWGTAFRAPDALNLYRNYTLGGRTTYISNPSLTPETSTSIDIGVEQGLARSGLLKAYIFHSNIEDLISTRDVGTSGTTKERVNIGEARVQGLELAWMQPLPMNLRLHANYTLSDTKVIDNPVEPASVGKQLTDIPRHMANLGIGYDDTQWYGRLNVHHMSKRYMNSANTDTVTGVPGAYDPYTLVSAKLGYRVSANVDLSLSVSNLLDKEYFNSVWTEGRAWFAQASLRF